MYTYAYMHICIIDVTEVFLYIDDIVIVILVESFHPIQELR